jgi:hypothetical protein
MSLVPCRACGHEVDTSALACPQCGATDPGHKLSRQQRNLIVSLTQFVIVALLLVWGGLYLWRTTIPMVKEILGRSQTEQVQESHN